MGVDENGKKKFYNFCGLDFYRFGIFVRIYVFDIIINDLWYVYNMIIINWI